MDNIFAFKRCGKLGFSYTRLTTLITSRHALDSSYTCKSELLEGLRESIRWLFSTLDDVKLALADAHSMTLILSQ